MSAGDIQARIKRGLARAIERTSYSSSDLVYKVDSTQSGGDGTPLNPGTVTETDILLVDAIFPSFDLKSLGQSSTGGTEIRASDKKMISNNDVQIKVGDVIKQGAVTYTVINVECFFGGGGYMEISSFFCIALYD